jgi:hypothetical protein
VRFRFKETSIINLEIIILDENDQQYREPHLYQGSSNPSRSFKILQSMTQPENAGE